MELAEVIRQRKMVRSFMADVVDPATVDGLVDRARRVPSAGNTQAVEFLVLDTVETCAAYWDVTLPEERRADFRWPGLVAAPVLILPVVRPDAYPDRYAEPDKVRTGLGAGVAEWPVPYWWVDAGMAVHTLLLSVVDAGLGACLFGVFDHESAVRSAFGVPDDRRLVGCIALGHPDAEAEAATGPGRSATRPRRPLPDVLHRNRFRHNGFRE